jgi:hypothetical protein
MKDNRVLSRLGARELSYDETENVSGAIGFHTNVCSFAASRGTTTVNGDNDGCPDMD